MLKKSRNRMLCGVCGGIAEHFHLDPTLVRLVTVMFTACTGVGFLAYLICAIVFPSADS